ncbi:MAG TPA: lipopolysaccharide biosynthesis protein [Saprospiraceae bacterium]|nr:lipopolysaccharide biosynthesis protein [Saprospiraceae bacterium]HMQ84671.1 lipopolysaccharide biosynthesis protein [Saprospiraceae bacterium]
MENLHEKTVKGLTWNGLGSVVVQIDRLLAGIILANLLDPKSFGLIAILTIFVGFGLLFQDLGFGAALVQKKIVTDIQNSSIFWINISIGLILTTFGHFSGFFLAKLFDQEELSQLMTVLSFTFLINSIAIIPLSILKRSVDFKKIAQVTVISSLFSSISAITLAYWGYGVWALVIRALVNSIFSTILYFVVVKWLPKPRFSWKDVKPFIKFGLNYSGAGIFNYFSRKVDDIAIGKFLGSEALGLYSRGYSFLMIPVVSVRNEIIKVMFPILSTKQDDKIVLKTKFLSMVKVIAFLCFPILFGGIATSEFFVEGFLGESWLGMVNIMKIMCVCGLVEVLNIGEVVFMATGQTGLLLRISIFTRVIFILLILAGVFLGIDYVALAVLIGTLINFLVNFKYLQESIDLSSVHFFNAIKQVLVISIAMYIALVTASHYLAQLKFSPLINFFILFLLGGAFWISAILKYRPYPSEYIISKFLYYKSKVRI